MLSNNSIVAVFSKEPLIASTDKHEFGMRCNISQSYAKKDESGNPILDDNGKRIYVKDFSGYVKFLGDAYKFIKGKEIPENHPIRIRIDNMGVKTFTINKEVNGEMKKQYCTDILVFKASDLENNTPKPSTSPESYYTDDDDLPFD